MCNYLVQYLIHFSVRYLLAFAFGYMGEHGLWAVNSDAEKHVLLAALAIVECIAYTASRIKR